MILFLLLMSALQKMRYARQGEHTLRYFLIGTSFRFLSILCGILAMVLFEVLHINNKKQPLFWLLAFSAKNILFIFKSLLLAYCTVFSLYTSLPPNSVYSVVSVTRPVYRKYSRSDKFRLTIATRLIVVVSGCHLWQSV